MLDYQCARERHARRPDYCVLLNLRQNTERLARVELQAQIGDKNKTRLCGRLCPPAPLRRASFSHSRPKPAIFHGPENSQGGTLLKVNSAKSESTSLVHDTIKGDLSPSPSGLECLCNEFQFMGTSSECQILILCLTSLYSNGISL